MKKLIAFVDGFIRAVLCVFAVMAFLFLALVFTGWRPPG